MHVRGSLLEAALGRPWPGLDKPGFTTVRTGRPRRRERWGSMVLFGRESHGSLPPEKRPGMTIVAVRRFPSHLAFRIGFGSRRRLFSPFLGISVFLGVFFLSLARDRISSGTTDRLIQRAIDSLRFLRSEAARIRRVSFSILEVSSLLRRCLRKVLKIRRTDPNFRRPLMGPRKWRRRLPCKFSRSSGSDSCESDHSACTAHAARTRTSGVQLH